MSTIKVKVTDQLAEFIDTPPIAAGDVNVDAVQFDLSNEWKSGYELMAVFWRADSKTRYTCLLDESYIATVPSEVMKSEGIVVFGVCGISTSKTLTSSTLSYTILDGAVVKFDTANVDIYDELIKLFKNTKITSGQITSNGHLVFKKVDGTTVDVGSGISLTTEQVNTAFKEFIEDYAEEMDYTKVNIAVITRLKEIHKNGIIQFWAGTKAEYEAITPADNVFYIITDEDPLTDVIKEVEQNAQEIGAIANDVSSLETTVNDLKSNGADELIADDKGWTVQKFASGAYIAWILYDNTGDTLNQKFCRFKLPSIYKEDLPAAAVAMAQELSYVENVDDETTISHPVMAVSALLGGTGGYITITSAYGLDGKAIARAHYHVQLTGRWK